MVGGADAVGVAAAGQGHQVGGDDLDYPIAAVLKAKADLAGNPAHELFVAELENGYTVANRYIAVLAGISAKCQKVKNVPVLSLLSPLLSLAFLAFRAFGKMFADRSLGKVKTVLQLWHVC